MCNNTVNISKNLLILDAGCGMGKDSIFSKHYRCDLIGLDLSASYLKKNRNLLNKICASIYWLPFRASSFDGIICEWVIEHLNEPLKAFDEFKKVLKTNGFLIVVTSNILNPVIFIGGRLLPERITKKLFRILYQINEEVFPLRYKCNTMGALDSLLQKTGFRRLITTTANNPWYCKFNRILYISYQCFEYICAKFRLWHFDIYILAVYRRCA